MGCVVSQTYFLIGSYYQEHLAKLLDHLQCVDLPSYSILCNEQRGKARTPQGYANVYNGLIRAALNDRECEFIWLLNDDAEPFDNCLEATQAILVANPTYGAVFPVETWDDDGSLVSIDPTTAQLRPIGELVSATLADRVFAGFACVCIRRQAWLDVGEMDESLGRGYNEDLDWGIRAWKAGWQIGNWREECFLHVRGATFERLVAEGQFDKEEPYDGARRVKEKWPWLWSGESVEVTMARLHQWYLEAKSP